MSTVKNQVTKQRENKVVTVARIGVAVLSESTTMDYDDN